MAQRGNAERQVKEGFISLLRPRLKPEASFIIPSDPQEQGSHGSGSSVPDLQSNNKKQVEILLDDDGKPVIMLLDGKEEVMTRADWDAALAVQRAWRRRSNYLHVKDLKQKNLCTQLREEMAAGQEVECEACASSGKKSADVKSRNLKKAFKEDEELLFRGMPNRVQIVDRGDNWNERWQSALSLPNGSPMEKGHKRASLDAVYSDFVHTAVTYGRTIISEYFLHEYMKSVRPKRLGGVAGGKKYLWRGILFKLADGSQGPYGGSDEAAAKAAGHELRGASEYLKTGVGLCVPPMCLLDYKGFRMLAQAHLPLGPASLKMGTNDGGRTVLNDCPRLARCTAEAAGKLGLREHIVGGKQAWVKYHDQSGAVYTRKRNVGGQLLHAAADVEGHQGKDSRMYLLDLARAFPPEDPDATPHLSGMLSVSAKVVVQKEGERAKAGTVNKAHDTLMDYDILYQDGTVEKAMPAHMLRDLRLFIFYRLMRPEFVRDRGRTVLNKVKLKPNHKFPTVRVTNPMMFAITHARKNKKTGTNGNNSNGNNSNGSSKNDVASSSSGSAPSTRRHDRYTAGDAGGGVISGAASSGKGNYTRGDASLAPVSERRGDGGMADEPAESAYEEFGGERRGSGYAGDGGGGGGGGGGLVDDQATAVDSDWKDKAMKLGIAFVSTKEKYFEGFEKAEVEEDEEELKRRGGIGYRQFHEPDGYDEAEADSDDGDGDGDGHIEDARGLVDGGAGGVNDGATGSARGGAFAAVPEGESQFETASGVPEEKRDFERSNLLRRHGTFGKKTIDHADGPVPAPQQQQRRWSPANPARGSAGRRALWPGETEGGSEESEDDTSSYGSGENDGYQGGFETQSDTSSFSTATGRTHERTYSDLLQIVRTANPSASPRTVFPRAPAIEAVGGPMAAARAAPGSGAFPPPPAAGGGGGYEPFSSKSLLSNASGASVSDLSSPHLLNRGLGGGGPPGEECASNGRHGGGGGGGGGEGGGGGGGGGNDDDLDSGGSEAGVPPVPGYDEFVSTPTTSSAAYDGFEDNGDLPPPMGLVSGYDDFDGSTRSLPRSERSSSTIGGPRYPAPPPPPPQPQPQQLQSPPPPNRAPAPPVPAGGAPAAAAAAAPPKGHLPNGREEDGGPPPLSPDALTAFSNGDPEAKERNRDVTEATQFLLTVLVPATAMLLCSFDSSKLSKINLAQELHRYGVNMRHIGLLRAYVTPPTREAASSFKAAAGPPSGVHTKNGKTSAGILRDRALVEVVVRTLKLVLRGFQRRWMKSEQSSSEQGMHMLVTQFLNLVTGQHERSSLFWNEHVTTGVCQRFGTVALTESERAGLWAVCSDRPDLLLTIVKELVKVTGVRFKESVNHKLRNRSTNIVKFEFKLTDIRDIEAVVTPMTIYQS